MASSKISSKTLSTSALFRPRFTAGRFCAGGISRCGRSSHIPGMVRLLERPTSPLATIVVVVVVEKRRLPLESGLAGSAPSFGLSKYLRILSSIFLTLSDDVDASYCFFILKDDGDFGLGGFGDW